MALNFTLIYLLIGGAAHKACAQSLSSFSACERLKSESRVANGFLHAHNDSLLSLGYLYHQLSDLSAADIPQFTAHRRQQPTEMSQASLSALEAQMAEVYAKIAQEHGLATAMQVRVWRYTVGGGRGSGADVSKTRHRSPVLLPASSLIFFTRFSLFMLDRTRSTLVRLRRLWDA